MEQHRKSGPARGSWGKRIGVTLGVLALFLVVLYFIATSSGFVKAFVLPKVGAALNAKVTADQVTLRPFSSIQLRNLRVDTTGPEPLLTAEELLVRYSLMDIIGGHINVHELTLSSPVINIIAEPDGSSNLDPVLENDEPAAELPQITLRNVSLKNGTLRQLKKTSDGKVDRTELEGINVTIDQVGNGQSGKLTLQSSFVVEQNTGTNSVLAGDLSGAYNLALDEDLLPQTVQGSSKINISRTSGSFGDLNGMNVSLEIDLTPREIRQIALRFAKGNQQLGQARVSGPLDREKMEGNLKVELLSLDKNILALAAAGSGYDFGNTSINSTNQVAISQNGSFFAANGNLAGRRISLSKDQMTTPEIALNLAYRLAVNTSDKSALLEQLSISGSSDGSEFLRANLDQQMNLSWGETVKGYKDAALRVVLTNFNLADWKAILGTNLQAGIVNANINLISQQDGKVLNTEVRSRLSNLTAQFGTNRVENALLTFDTAGAVENLNIINLPRYALTLSQGNAPLLQATGALRYQLDSQSTTAQITADGALNQLLSIAALENVSAAAGTLNASANYTDVGGKRKANGRVGIEGFTGSYDAYLFTNFQASIEFNIETDNQVLDIHRAAATFARGFNAGGTIDLKGQYHLDRKTGQFTFKTVDLNQNTFGPILAPSLGENRLVSISLNASGEAKLDPEGESAVKADIKIANWVVQDKAGTLPKTPLSMDIALDGGMRKEILDLRQLALQLTPTDRAKNKLQLEAKLDLSKTNPAPSSVTIRSESFDITPYYNLFAGHTATNPAASPAETASVPSAPAQAGPPQEPEPVALPFQQLTADLKIDRFYLRGVAISNWVGNVRISSNIVQLDPFRLELNGGQVNLTGRFDLGRPGYQYALAFKASDVPLGPLATSFDIAASNQLTGTFIADAQIRGAGVTGPNLRKNLGGGVNFAVTNINYLPGGPKLRMIVVPISIALRVPELAQTPINWLAGQTQITNGTVRVENATVESEAFLANLTGTIQLADVLTNSPLNLPLDLSLRRSLAEKANILPANTPPEAKYARLGNVYTIEGTVGAPKPEANLRVLAGLTLKGAAGFGLGDEKTEKALGVLGNILTGQKGSTNAASTNTTQSASPAAELIKGLGGLLGGSDENTQPGAKPNTNAPPQEKRSNPLRDLLRALPGTGKE